MKRWFKRIAIVSFAGGIALVLLFVFSVWYTNRSDFCTTCHYMQPFYDAWASSTHSGVPCRDCHYEPGYSSVIKGKLRDMNQLVKYWTKAYQRSKPWAEISDASCLRSGCHETRLLKGKVTFGEVIFDHTPHLDQMRRGKKLRCTSCHSQIVQGEHMSVTETTCILCHFKRDDKGQNVAQCTICHTPPTMANSGDEPPKYDHTRVVESGLACVRCHGSMVVGDGAVPRERCYACHWERDRLDLFHDTELMHTKHITENKIECDRCHLSMQHKSISKDQAMPECQTCHTDFHSLQLDLYVGKGGIGIPDLPNPMYKKGLSCQGCHILHPDPGAAHVNGETFVASGKSCEPCHGKGYDRLLKNWNTSTKHKIDAIGTALVDADKIRKRMSGQAHALAVADSLIGEARHNYDMVRLGRPIHNIVYANELLEVSGSRLKEFFAQAAPDYPMKVIVGGEKLVPSNCLNCHIGIEKIDAQVFGLPYSHQRHIIAAKVPCNKCHSNQRRHGELIVQRRDCLSCHHSQEERDCGYCHDIQASILKGTQKSLPLEEPDIMYSAGVGCRDCHELPDRSIVKPVPQRCVDCHDREYADTQREWLNEFAALNLLVRENLRHVEMLPAEPLRDIAIDQTKQILKVIDTDGSRGSHNHFEQMRILEARLQVLTDLLAKGS